MISIVMATFNSGATLQRSLDSLRAQRGADFELLIADGASSDATLAILERNADLVAWQTSAPDRGVYDAWNRAIAMAKGDWLLFLGSDDGLDRPDTLARLEQALEAIPPAERKLCFAFGQTALMDKGRAIEWLGRTPMSGDRLDSASDIPFSHTGLVHHRSLFDELGLYDAAFRSAGDYEFMLRAAANPQTRFRHVPMVVARMACGGMSNGAASRLRHYREMQQARRHHGLAPSPPWLRAALMRARCLLLLDRHLGGGAALAAANIYRWLRGKPARSAV